MDREVPATAGQEASATYSCSDGTAGRRYLFFAATGNLEPRWRSALYQHAKCLRLHRTREHAGPKSNGIINIQLAVRVAESGLDGLLGTANLREINST